MRMFQDIEYDVSSLRHVRGLLQLCMLASQAYVNMSSAIVKEDVLACTKLSGVICATPENRVPQPTHIDFRDLGTSIKIMYFVKTSCDTVYLTHINAAYSDGGWFVVPGIDDRGKCSDESQLALDCAVERLRDATRRLHERI